MYAVYVIASMLAKSKTNKPFPPAQYETLKTKIRRLAEREISPVRQFAIEGLGLTKDAEDAEFLEKLGGTTKDPYVKKFALETAKEIRNSNVK